MKREETAQILGLLSAAFPSVQITKETATVYHEVLQDLDAEDAMKAAREILMTADRFPSPAALRRIVASNRGMLAPSPTHAFAEVMEKARVLGRMQRPRFSHPSIEEVVDALSWREICMSENPEALRAHFLRLYDERRVVFDDSAVKGSMNALPAAEVRQLGVGA